MDSFSKEAFISIDIAPNGVVNIQNAYLHKASLGDYTVFSREKLSVELASKVACESLAKRINGVLVYEDIDYLIVYVDPFRTIPLFYCKKENGGIFVCSDINRCAKVCGHIDIDITGFWELIKYGICLGKRTLYSRISQCTGASYLKIRKRDSSDTLQDYWDYRVTDEDRSRTMNETVERLDSLLRNVFFKKTNSVGTKQFIMGLSGGLDSRLSLNYLSELLCKDDLDLFTFGTDSRSLEYRYARQIAEKAGFREPCFCELSDSAYEKSLQRLTVQSAGHINLLHGHISFCLANVDSHQAMNCQISNYFSDALFGWCCVWPVQNIFVGFQAMVKEVENEKEIPRKSKIEIIEDLKSLFDRGKFGTEGNASYSSFFEYFYLVEKNVKMHSYLMHLQSSLMPILPVYTDYDLAIFMISTPIEFRRGKDILFWLLKTKSKFSDLSIGDISSRDFRGVTKKLSWKTREGIKFKIKNRFNALGSVFGLRGGWLRNWYLTEDIQSVYHSQFRSRIRSARHYLSSEGVFDKNIAAKRFPALRVRPYSIGENCQLLSIAEGMRILKQTLLR